MYIENMQMLYFILNGGKWRRTFLQTWIHTMRILKKQKLNASMPLQISYGVHVVLLDATNHFRTPYKYSS